MKRLVAIFLALLLAGPAWAAGKLALVIGNDTYAHLAGLGKAGNDAAAIAAALEAKGFEVTVLRDIPRFKMLRELKRFEDSLTEDTTAFLFYAGHGVEIAGANYLLPTDTPLFGLDEKYLVPEVAIPLDKVISALGRARASVIVLDACRNDPFEEAAAGGRSLRGNATVNRGLADLTSRPKGMFIVYSAGAKQFALDGLGEGDENPNSVFTRVFLEEMNVPGRHIRDIVVKTRNRVFDLAATVKHEQFPAYYDQLTRDLVLAPGQVSDPVADAFDRALSEGRSEELMRLARAHPDHPRAAEARAAAERLRGRALDREIANALGSLDRTALRRVAGRASGHPRADAIDAALRRHDEIDREVNQLDLDALRALFAEMNRHPRREEVRIAIRRAIAHQTCSLLLAYGFKCPDQMQALTAVATITAARPELQTAAPPQGAAEDVAPPDRAATDPLKAFLDDVDDAALGRAESIRLDYLQTALKALGFYSHAVDGRRGPGTDRAIAAWRRSHGSTAHGELSAREKVVLMKQGAELSAAARAYLGVMYGLGLGVRRDPTESRSLLEAAAGDGFADAAIYLENLARTWK